MLGMIALPPAARPISFQGMSRGRAPRVCLYDLAVNGREPEPSLLLARAFAERQRWQVGQSFIDQFPWSTCNARPGWGQVRNEVQAERADGVVLLAPSVLSRHADEVLEQVAWFRGHGAFIAVAESGAGRVMGSGPVPRPPLMAGLGGLR